jgi:hypothetical protein
MTAWQDEAGPPVRFVGDGARGAPRDGNRSDCRGDEVSSYAWSVGGLRFKYQGFILWGGRTDLEDHGFKFIGG